MGKPTGGDEGGRLPELIGQAPVDAIDEAREAVGEPRLDGGGRVLADWALGRREVDSRQLRRAGGEGLQGDFDARADHPAEILPGARDDVEVGGGPEVDGDACALQLRM